MLMPKGVVGGMNTAAGCQRSTPIPRRRRQPFTTFLSSSSPLTRRVTLSAHRGWTLQPHTDTSSFPHCLRHRWICPHWPTRQNPPLGNMPTCGTVAGRTVARGTRVARACGLPIAPLHMFVSRLPPPQANGYVHIAAAPLGRGEGTSLYRTLRGKSSNHNSTRSSSSSSIAGGPLPAANAWHDNSEGVSRLVRPGSKSLLLRPPGWGTSHLLRDLRVLLEGGPTARARFGDPTSCWLASHRGVLLRQPSTPTVLLDGSQPFGILAEQVQQQIQQSEQKHPGSQTTQPRGEDGGLLGAMRRLSALNRRRVAVLIDAYDESDNPAAMAGLIANLTAMVGAKDAVGMLLVTGTFRMAAPSPIASSSAHAHYLDGLTDLTLDFQHNGTVGITVPEAAEGGEDGSWDLPGVTAQPVRYRWSDSLQRPVLVTPAKNSEASPTEESTAAEDTAMGREEPLSLCDAGDGVGEVGGGVGGGGGYGGYGGGGGGGGGGSGANDGQSAGTDAGPRADDYWYGGFQPSGERELVRPFVRDSIIRASRSVAGTRLQLLKQPLTSAQLWQLVEGMTRYRPLEAYATASFADSVLDEPKSGHESSELGTKPPTELPGAGHDTAALWLQAGLLTVGSRSLLFHEFHTYAFLRLAIPGAAASDAIWSAVRTTPSGVNSNSTTLAPRHQPSADPAVTSAIRSDSRRLLLAAQASRTWDGCSDCLKALVLLAGRLADAVEASVGGPPEGDAENAHQRLGCALKFLLLTSDGGWQLQNNGQDIVLESDPVDSFARTNDHLDPNPGPVTFVTADRRTNPVRAPVVASQDGLSRDCVVMMHPHLGTLVWEGGSTWQIM